MTAGFFAPESVFRACCVGVGLYERSGGGGLPRAAEFGLLVSRRFPVDLGLLAECAAAHEGLAGEVDSGPVMVARLLWGGDTAFEWADRLVREAHEVPVAPVGAVAPVPVAAAVDPVLEPVAAGRDWVGLSAALAGLDRRAVEALEAVVFGGFRQALLVVADDVRRRANRRVSLAAQTEAGLGDGGLNEGRARLDAAPPHGGWWAAGGPLLAAIDADPAGGVEAGLDGFEAGAVRVLRRARRDCARLVASRLGVPVAAVSRLLPDDGLVDAAVRAGRVELDAWLADVLAAGAGPDDLLAVDVPDGVLGAVSGVLAGGEGCDVAGVWLSAGGRPVPQVFGVAAVDGLLESGLVADAGGVVPAAVWSADGCSEGHDGRVVARSGGVGVLPDCGCVVGLGWSVERDLS